MFVFRGYLGAKRGPVVLDGRKFRKIVTGSNLLLVTYGVAVTVAMGGWVYFLSKSIAWLMPELVYFIAGHLF
jgi:hypothetical protein